MSAAPMATATPPTILVDIVVTDGMGSAITDLKATELEVSQEGRVQRIASFRPKGRPGGYEITYVPASGKPAGVTMRALRRGAHIAGPDGPNIHPHVLPGLSPFEAPLAALLDAQPAANDFPCETAVLRFEARPDGVHHTFVVDVPLAAFRLSQDQGSFVGASTCSPGSGARPGSRCVTSASISRWRPLPREKGAFVTSSGPAISTWPPAATVSRRWSSTPRRPARPHAGSRSTLRRWFPGFE